MSDYWTSIYDSDDRIRDLERLQPGAVFDWLNDKLPSIGTAVDWDNVVGEHTHWFIKSEANRDGLVSDFLAALPREAGAVLHEGDSLSPFPVRIKRSGLASAVEALLEIPEHHYFVDEQYRWIGVFRTEGDVDLVLLRPEPEHPFTAEE